ncbi:LysR substrate-binding domain-containing protein [Streptomyces sp. NBC_01239]|uniref:LysR substrate-binding domain-containing protein n=1 Tax=Streptomyces sp. NBC_01239 TaxID=2903792 RepID=UPI002253DF18|nr:LysR substrate-binding domain-containing protein [Streptomyces sp. NBC_01239]MCX4816640.1 LysR substrate-binding domain-containing protein [Streptomyces sp. NBC_01239]
MDPVPARQSARRLPRPPAHRRGPRPAHGVARASQISTAMGLVAQGLGVTVVPASAIPEGFEELACPLLPSLTEPVLVGVRRNPGTAETALLDHLHQQNWCGTNLLRRPATD